MGFPTWPVVSSQGLGSCMPYMCQQRGAVSDAGNLDGLGHVGGGSAMRSQGKGDRHPLSSPASKGLWVTLYTQRAIWFQPCQAQPARVSH